MLIKVFGMRRSGNHAVINWLLGLLDAPLFFNNVRLYGNPLNEFGPVTVPDGVRVTIERRQGQPVATGIPVVAGGGEADNGDLLLSYEHADMAMLDMGRLDQGIAKVFGPYPDVHNVVIVRNPLNVFASYLKLHGWRGKDERAPLRRRLQYRIADWLEANFNGRGGLSVLRTTRPERELVSLWKTYAGVALLPDSPTRGQFIPVIFDQFVVDRAYRDAVATRLGIRNTDRNLDFVSSAGRGSSFDGLNRPVPTDLLVRWRGTAVSDRLRPYVQEDFEFQDYCLRLFSSTHLDLSLFSRRSRPGQDPQAAQGPM